MSNRRNESLAQRVANTKARQDGPETPTVVVPEPESPPPVRHCWFDGPHGRQAALLLEWRNLGGRYDGRIAVVLPSAEGWATVELWVDGAMLSRV
jgi:hypothetical protein